MASIDALVDPTRQESFTWRLTRGYRLSAHLPLSSNQALNRVVSTGTEQNALWVLLTWLALPLMTSLLTSVMSTVKHFATDTLTSELLISAMELLDLFATET